MLYQDQFSYESKISHDLSEKRSAVESGGKEGICACVSVCGGWKRQEAG